MTQQAINITGYGLLPGLFRIYQRRSLLGLFIVRNVRTNYQGSYLGLLWMTINPLLILCLYSFVFGVVFNGSFRGGSEESGMDYSLGLFLSLTLFQLFSDSMNNSTTAIANNPNLVKKVVFPLEILPAAVVGAQFAQFMISMSLVILGLIILGNGFYWTWLWLPLLVFPVFIMGLGIAYLFALIGAFMRDINQITRFLSTMLLFGSAIFFSTKVLPLIAQDILAFNPLVHAIEQTRSIMLWGEHLQFLPIVYLYVFSIAIFIIGFSAFQKARAYIADVL